MIEDVGEEMRRLHQEMDRMWGDVGGWAPERNLLPVHTKEQTGQE